MGAYNRNFTVCPDLGAWDGQFSTLLGGQHFYLERGVRQGCPLSGILFVIAMELLAQSIRRSKDIKGINLQGDEVVKLS